MRDDEIADLPLWRLSGMIRSREITSVRLTTIYLERIKAYDEGLRLNSYITVARETALAQASQRDDLMEAGKSFGPLHGLPLALKDNIETEGIRTTGGSRILSSHIPRKDASVVARLKAAGAVILGKTNMPEFALGATTTNPHYGPTRNPYDLDRTPGGSSGGSAAATAAGLCAASLGTDTGGSVRVPAGLCGVVGMRPTTGRVGRGGIIPLSFSRDTVGPITRSVRDAAMILEIIAGRDGNDPMSARRPVMRYSDHAANGLKAKRFGLPKRFIEEAIHGDTQKVMNEAVRVIQAMGGVVREIEIPSLDLAYTADFNVVMPEAICLLGEYLKAANPLASIEDCLDLMGADVREVLGRETGGPGSRPVPGYRYLSTLRNECEIMKRGFGKAMRGLDALLFPTTPAPAPRIDEDHEMELNGAMKSVFLTNIRNTLPLSIVGAPAISVPAGYSKTGLPIGLQIVARPWEEAKLLSMAYAFEDATKVRRAPALPGA
jgi:aspartyl-tRNA(Asn)/glutamyl-tRNA(Gln) amidotransferase subunit A